MRTITLELLRHGPPNNQLLSPLTQYLALCENHSAVTVHIPFMHNQFLHRLRALSYHLGDEARAFQLQDTAAELRDVIGQIPGLIAELSGVSTSDPPKEGTGKCEETPLAHLRLVISASELSLLPFELALAPNGFPGSGQSLLLQSQYPLTLTRETRRVADRCIEWPKQPKILFVAAAPPEVGPIPVEAHLLALRTLIDPYIGYWETEAEREREIGKSLVFLPNATAEAVEKLCAEGGFSHIHVLAHGKEYMEGYDVRYGMAFHNADDPHGPADVVSGERLKTIMRPTRSAGQGTLSRPTLVTLASCNTGKVGTVYGMGASIAHALHEAGIPLVIAGQFPISFIGSVLMVEVLYEGLLWGKDPRISISDLRRRLHSQFPKAHDWASIVAYATFPPEFEDVMGNAQIEMARRSVDIAIEWADRATAGDHAGAAETAPPPAPDTLDTPGGAAAAVNPAPETSTGDVERRKSREELDRILDKINAARDRMKALLGGSSDRRARVYHQLASTEKRRAEVYLVLGRLLGGGAAPGKETRKEYVAQFYRSMLDARKYYWAGFMEDRTKGWRIVQYLSSHLILQRLKEEFIPAGDLAGKDAALAEGDHNRPDALWALARVFALNDLRSSSAGATVWALTDLIELSMLGLLISKDERQHETLAADARRYAQMFVARMDMGLKEHQSVSRQIRRYVTWYSEIADIGKDIVSLAGDIVKILDQGAPSTDR